MTDARFSERWLNDRRFLRLPDDAFRLFVLSLAWSVSNRTDGRLYDDDLALIPGVPRDVPGAYDDSGLPVVPRDVPSPVLALVKAGLWERVTDNWLIAEFEATQTTMADLAILENSRRRERDKKRRQRAKAAGLSPGTSEGTALGQDRLRTGTEAKRGKASAALADERSARAGLPAADATGPDRRQRPSFAQTANEGHDDETDELSTSSPDQPGTSVTGVPYDPALQTWGGAIRARR